jgi:hypothetical protein
LDESFPFLDHSAAAWAVLSGALSGIGAWFLSLRKINASVEHTRIRLNAEAAAAELAERTAFRGTLLAEVSSMRQMIKECDEDRYHLRDRLNATEGQILVIKASNEIVERWMTFFKSTSGLETPPARRDVNFDLRHRRPTRPESKTSLTHPCQRHAGGPPATRGGTLFR